MTDASNERATSLEFIIQYYLSFTVQVDDVLRYCAMSAQMTTDEFKKQVGLYKPNQNRPIK